MKEERPTREDDQRSAIDGQPEAENGRTTDDGRRTTDDQPLTRDDGEPTDDGEPATDGRKPVGSEIIRLSDESAPDDESAPVDEGVEDRARESPRDHDGSDVNSDGLADNAAEPADVAPTATADETDPVGAPDVEFPDPPAGGGRGGSRGLMLALSGCGCLTAILCLCAGLAALGYVFAPAEVVRQIPGAPTFERPTAPGAFTPTATGPTATPGISVTAPTPGFATATPGSPTATPGSGTPGPSVTPGTPGATSVPGTPNPSTTPGARTTTPTSGVTGTPITGVTGTPITGVTGTPVITGTVTRSGPFEVKIVQVARLNAKGERENAGQTVFGPDNRGFAGQVQFVRVPLTQTGQIAVIWERVDGSSFVPIRPPETFVFSPSFDGTFWWYAYRADTGLPVGTYQFTVALTGPDNGLDRRGSLRFEVRPSR